MTQLKTSSVALGRRALFCLLAGTGFLVSGSLSARLPTNFPAACPPSPNNANEMDISQHFMWTGKGGYVTANARGAPANPGVLTVAGIPAGSTIVAAFLYTVQMGWSGNPDVGTNTTFAGTPVSGYRSGFGDFTNNYGVHPIYGAPLAPTSFDRQFYNWRYNVTSLVTGNGSYAVTGGGPWGHMAVSIVVVYQNLSLAPDTTVTIADGMFAWWGGHNSGVYEGGYPPVKTDLNWGCAGNPACSPVNNKFTRFGGTVGPASGGAASTDQFLDPGSGAIRWESAPGVYNVSNPAPYVDMDTYNNLGVLPGESTISWNLGHATTNLTDTKDLWWANVLVNSSSCQQNSPTPTVSRTYTLPPTLTRTSTPPPTLSATPPPTLSSTPPPTLSSTPQPSSTRSSTALPTLSQTPLPSSTATVLSITPTPTPTPPNSSTRTPTVTPTVTATPTPFTNTPTPTITATPTRNTYTPTPTPTPPNSTTTTPTVTSTLTATPTPFTNTPSPTITATPTRNTYTATPTPSPPGSSTRTPSATPTLTATPTPFTNTATPTITATPTRNTYTATPTRTPTRTISSTPTETPSFTNTRSASVTRSITATPTLNTQTATPTHSVTRTLTPTPTNSPSFSVTPSLTVTRTLTATRTISYTHSATATASATPPTTPTSSATSSATRTATPSFSATRTATETATITVTRSASPTASDTRTATQSATITATRSATPTATLSATASATPTATASFSASPTLTVTATYSETPIPEPFHITLTLYNSAGEVVKQFYEGSSQVSPDSLNIEYGVPMAGNVPIIVTINGIASVHAPPPIVWTGQNDNGQTVSNGAYTFKMEVKDQFGDIRTLTQVVNVIGNVVQDSLAIYNSAGELVVEMPLGSMSASAVDFHSMTHVVGGDIDPATGQSSTGYRFEVKGSDNSVNSFTWDGLNSLGQPVDSGTYLIKLVHSELGVRTLVKTDSLAVIRAPGGPAWAAASSAVIGPNPLSSKGPGQPAIATLSYAPPGTGHGVANLFDVAGELVAQAWDSSQSGQLRFDLSPFASGIYVVEFRIENQGRVLARRMLKLALSK